MANQAAEPAPLPPWRTAILLVLLTGAVLLWLLLIASAADGLSFEPTSEAVARAARAGPETVGFAIGSLVLTALLALTGGRLEPLLLAAPAALVLVCRAIAPDSAVVIISGLSTPFAVGGCLIIMAIRRVRRPEVAVRVRIAAGLSKLYAVALSVLVAVLAFEQVTGAGHLGAEHLAGLSLRGLLMFSALLLFVAVLLWTGADRLVRSGQRRLIVVPLVIFTVIGTVGEVVDVLGATSLNSDLTGLGILASAALPVLLLSGPRTRSRTRHRGP